MSTNFAREVWAGSPLNPQHQLWADDEVGQYQLIHEDPDLISFYRWCRENGWQPISNSVLTRLNRDICRYEKRTH